MYINNKPVIFLYLLNFEIQSIHKAIALLQEKKCRKSFPSTVSITNKRKHTSIIKFQSHLTESNLKHFYVSPSSHVSLAFVGWKDGL